MHIHPCPTSGKLHTIYRHSIRGASYMRLQSDLVSSCTFFSSWLNKNDEDFGDTFSDDPKGALVGFGVLSCMLTSLDDTVFTVVPAGNCRSAALFREEKLKIRLRGSGLLGTRLVRTNFSSASCRAWSGGIGPRISGFLNFTLSGEEARLAVDNVSGLCKSGPCISSESCWLIPCSWRGISR